MEPLTLAQTARPPKPKQSPRSRPGRGSNLTFNRITGPSCVIPRHYHTSAINKAGRTRGEAFYEPFKC